MSSSPRRRYLVLAIHLALALFSSTSLADERTEARRHFRRGMELVVSGNLDEGISELELAYQILPHPNVLYNIGRAYAEAGHYEEALEFFARYLDSGPADAEEVRGYIAALEARIASRAAAVATPPESTDAPTSTSSSGEGVTRGSAEEIVELRLTAERIDALAQVVGGTELPTRAASLRALADRMERANREPAEATTEQTPSAPTAEVERPRDVDGIELASADTELYEERFVSSTRAALDPLDAPNSTTIITRQDIRLTGITALGELLRRVAGVHVMTTGPAETNIGIRGFNQRLSNRILLLVNGRSTYVDPLGLSIWQLQQFSVEDIERIEVVRGPASALYGANGFSGVVNVITRAAGADPGTEASVSAGSLDQYRAYVGASGRGGRDGRVGYRISTAYDQASRYTLPFDTDRADVHLPSTEQNVGTSLRTIRAFGNIDYRFGRSARAYVEGGTNFYTPAVLAAAGVFNDLYLKGTYSNVTAGVTSEWGGLRFFWTNIQQDADQFGLSSFASHVDWNTYDIEGTFAHEFDTGPLHHNVVAGGGYRRKFVDWANVFEQAEYENHFQAFAQDSIRIADRFTFVGSIRVDRHPLLVRPVFSPRGAIVGRIGDRQAIRASVSTAFRTQSFLDSYMAIVNPTPIDAVSIFGGGIEVYHRVLRTPRINPERILTAELGYQNSESDYVSIDAAAYLNRVSNILTLANDTQLYTLAQSLDPGYASISGFDPRSNTFLAGAGGFENQDGVYYTGGLEVAGRVFPVDGLDVYANYSLNITYFSLDGDVTQQTRAPRHQLNTGVQYRGSLTESVGLDVALDVHAQSKTVWYEQQLVGNGLAVVPVDLRALYMINGRVALRLLGDRLSLGIVGYDINGLWGPAFRQHPLTQPIDARVLGNVGYRF